VIAALYCRKSNEQADAASVTRQEELARAFVARKGWQVDAAHVYVDDAVSGAEYLKRPAYLRMMAALDPAPPFGALVVEEQSRLGRDTGRVLLAIQALEEAGVEIWSYQGGGTRISVADESGEVNATVVGLVDRMHRRQSSTRGRIASRAKAEKGHVAGGVTYGYRNIRQVGHVVREIDADQAAVVRRIFAEIAAGRGFIRIARGLTADQVPSPRPGQGWGASTVRDVVFRDLYRGLVIYGRTRWQMKGGTKRKVRVPEAEWVRVDTPHLRIITEGEWRAAHQRLDRTRETYLRASNGQLGGRPESGLESKWLLTGFLACAVCHGGMSATWTFDARRERRPYYRCNTHRVRPERCANDHTVNLAALDADVLARLREDVLTPERIERVIRRAIDLHTAAPGDTAAQREALLDTLHARDRELAQYARAVASAPDLPVLVETMRATQRQRDEVAARLEHLDGLDRAVDTWSRQDGLGDEFRARLAEWQTILTGQPILGRQILRRLLVGRLVVTPQEDARGRCTAHAWAGAASYGRLLGGLVGGQPFGGPSGAACYHER
jgi:DNA invertase Pin-like site-specific DNA recombinase